MHKDVIISKINLFIYIFLICFLVHFMSALLVDLCVSVDEAEKERQHGLTSKLLSILVHYV